jgi:hypothetical protein
MGLVFLSIAWRKSGVMVRIPGADGCKSSLRDALHWQYLLCGMLGVMSFIDQINTLNKLDIC